ncbi:MAG: 4-hydroxy-tetrahydrodipicolinate synthase, partial [Clostridia bacterium]|nr:4-hydroxy-tetrahydrodipicolinate synthase [Clostridia bacterium]
MKKTIFTGAGVAIVTPFNSDLSVNYDKLGELIEYQIANGTDAIIICGTTGEASTLTDDEHREEIKFAVDKVAGRVPVIAGTGSNDTAYSIELTRYAKEVGADASLNVTPYYNKTTQRGLIKHFTAIADAVDLPMILYNVPGRTG